MPAPCPPPGRPDEGLRAAAPRRATVPLAPFGAVPGPDPGRLVSVPPPACPSPACESQGVDEQERARQYGKRAVRDCIQRTQAGAGAARHRPRTRPRRALATGSPLCSERCVSFLESASPSPEDTQVLLSSPSAGNGSSLSPLLPARSRHTVSHFASQLPHSRVITQFITRKQEEQERSTSSLQI